MTLWDKVMWDKVTSDDPEPFRHSSGSSLPGSYIERSLDAFESSPNDGYDVTEMNHTLRFTWRWRFTAIASRRRRQRC